MNILKFVALCLAMGVVTSVGAALAVDAFFWEADGNCLDSFLIHHLRDCR